MLTSGDFTVYGRKAFCAKEFIENATKAWRDVFPLSSCETNGDTQGNFVIFHGYLAGHSAERAEYLLTCDPIEYVGVYRGENIGFMEELVGVYVKSPEGVSSVYHLSKLAPITLYKPTRASLVSRFHEIRKLALDNREGLKDCGFDVNEKLMALTR